MSSLEASCLTLDEFCKELSLIVSRYDSISSLYVDYFLALITLNGSNIGFFYSIRSFILSPNLGFVIIDWCLISTRVAFGGRVLDAFLR